MDIYDGMKGNDLYLASYSGNSADAVLCATGTSPESKFWRVVFDSISFYKETIDVLEEKNDFIKSTIKSSVRAPLRNWCLT